MSINLALGRPSSSSSYVAPFGSERAVDGNVMPLNRWLCGTVPATLQVNLPVGSYINQWVVYHMGSAGWRSPDYNMSNYKLQGSMDGVSWYDLDIVSNNLSASTARNIQITNVNFVRVYVSSGLKINPKMASIVEFAVYGGSSPYLSNLALSNGTLSPVFASTTYSYTSSVPNNVDKITITPTAQDPNATIIVNGNVVASGTASVDIPLNVGDNTITVQVTSKTGGLVQAYSVVVTREDGMYLTNLEIKAAGVTMTLDPSFISSTFKYGANVDSAVSIVSVKPTAELSGAVITVNGVSIASGSRTNVQLLLPGETTLIVINVESADGTKKSVYEIDIVRANS